jgi:hypothetical protein
VTVEDDPTMALLARVPPPRALSEVEVERIAQSLLGARPRRARARRVRRRWLALPLVGATLATLLLLVRGGGAELRVGAGEAVALSDVDGGTVRLEGPGRLGYGQRWSDRPRLVDGTATLTTGPRPLRLQVARGAIELAPGSRLVVTVSHDAVRVATYAGTAKVEWHTGPVWLRAGEAARSSRGGAMELEAVERVAVAPPATETTPTPAATETTPTPLATEATPPASETTPTPAARAEAPRAQTEPALPATARAGRVTMRALAAAAPPSPAAAEPLPPLPAPSSEPASEASPPSPIVAETELLADALDALERAHRPERALALLDGHRDRFGDGPFAADAARLRVDALLELGRSTEALEVLDRLALDGDPSGRARELRLARAELRAAAGRWREARNDFAAVLASGASSERALYGAAASAVAVGERDEARALLRRYLDAHPQGAHAAAARRLLAR